MFKSLLALTAATALGANTEQDYRREFTQWMTEHGKTYETEELFYRYDVFKANMDKIEAHNADPTQKYTMAPNQFMDLSADEFGKIHLRGLVDKSSAKRPLGSSQASCTQFSGSTTESSVDWTAKGMVTAVKDQGQCGSCWAFSTTGSVEAAHAIQTGSSPTSLSEQQLMDCSWSYGNMGCNGGLMDYAFEYLIDNGGSCTEESYPYTAVSSHTCRTCNPVAQINGCQHIPEGDADALKAALAKQPVSIAIEADQYAFQFYRSGVLTGNCGTSLDHGVLAVGFDDTYDTPYWKVKNSWGATWGMDGYILIEQAGDKCGVSLSPSFPISA